MNRWRFFAVAVFVLIWNCLGRDAVAISVPTNFAEYGTAVNGFQDFFMASTRDPDWKVASGGDVYSQTGNGWLHVSAGSTGANHLIYQPAVNYSGSPQEILALVRMNAAMTAGNDGERGGVAAGVNTANSQGFNVLFRPSGVDSGATTNHVQMLNDALAWGPRVGSTTTWTTGTWYWMRLAINGASQTAAFWPADGATPESSAVTASWAQGARTGYAGITAANSRPLFSMDVGYVLIKAAALPSIAAGIQIPTLTWTGAGSNVWSTEVGTKNWLDGANAVDYTDGVDVLFNDANTPRPTVDIAPADVSPRSVKFNNTAVNYTLASSGGHGIAGTIGLTKTGTGTLTISNINTYTGGTTINAGVVEISSDDALGAASGALTFGGGALRTATNGIQSYRTMTLNTGGGTIDTNGLDSTWSGPIGGAGGLTKAGSGALTLSAANRFTGDTKINAGTLQLDHADALAGSTLDWNNYGGTLGFGFLTGATLGGLKGAQDLALPDNFALTVGGNNATYSGAIRGAGVALTKRGAGALTLSGAAPNTYTGDTTVLGGATGQALVSLYLNKPAGTVAIPGNLILGAGDTTQPEVVMSQPNQFAASTVVTFANAWGYWARFSLMGNNQTVAGLSSALQSGGVVQNGRYGVTAPKDATLTINTTGDYSFSGHLRDNDNGTTAVKLNLVKTGSGTQTITGGNVYHTGATTINGGTLVLVINNVNKLPFASPIAVNSTGGATLSGTGPLQNVTVNGGTVDPGLAGTGDLTMSALLLNNGSTLKFNPGANKIVVTSSGFFITGGASKVSVNVLGLAPGQYDLIDYEGAIGGSGLGALSLATNTPGYRGLSGSLIDDTASTVVKLDFAGAEYPVWTGAANANWDINTTQNWKLNASGSPTTYQQTPVGDAVGFDDSVTGPTTVNLTTTLSPTAAFFTNSTAVDYSLSGPGKLSGAASVLKSGSGTVTLATANDYTGGTTINAGTLVVSSDDNLGAASGSLVFGGGTLRTAGSMTLTRPVTLNTGGGTIDTDGRDATLSGPISGSGGLTKTGAGMLAIWGVNVYAGGTTINTGVVQISSDENLGAASGGMTFDGGALRTATSGVTSARTVTLNAGGGTFDTGGLDSVWSGPIQGAGALTKAGSGALTLSAANSFAGDTKINAGTLQLDHVNALAGSTLDYDNHGGTLGFGLLTGATLGGLKGAQDLALPDNFVLSVGNNNADTAYSGSISGNGAGLTKRGAGTITLGGPAPSTYTGGTTVAAGTLRLAASGALPGGDVAVEGTLDLNNFNATVAAISGNGTIDKQSAATPTNTLTLGSGTFTGTICNTQGKLGLTKTGSDTLTLSGNNTFTGPTVVNGGILKLAPMKAGLPVTNFDGYGAMVNGYHDFFTSPTRDPAWTPVGSDGYLQTGDGWLHVSSGVGQLLYQPGTDYSGSPVNVLALVKVSSVLQDDTGRAGLTAGTGTDGIGVRYLFRDVDDHDFADPLAVSTGKHTNLLDEWRFWGRGSAGPEDWQLDNLYWMRLTYDPIGDGNLTGKIWAADGTTPESSAVQIVDSEARHAAVPNRMGYAGFSGGSSTWDVAYVLIQNGDMPTTAVAGKVFGGSNCLPTATDLSIAAAATLDLGGDQQVASLSDYGGGGGTVTGSGEVSAVLTIGSVGTPASTAKTFSGVIQDHDTGAGTVALVINSPNLTQTLSGLNTYTGGTLVQQGTLVIAGSSALPAGGTLTIGAGGTLVLASGLAAGASQGAPSAAPVPEPGALVLLSAGALAAVAARFQRRRK